MSFGSQPIRMGVGLNAGVVFAGNVGSHRKRQFTVLGAPVNLVARLESETKQLGTHRRRGQIVQRADDGEASPIRETQRPANKRIWKPNRLWLVPHPYWGSSGFFVKRGSEHMSWNYQTSLEQIQKYLAGLGEIQVEKLVRDADLYALLTPTNCRQILEPTSTSTYQTLLSSRARRTARLTAA